MSIRMPTAMAIHLMATIDLTATIGLMHIMAGLTAITAVPTLIMAVPAQASHSASNRQPAHSDLRFQDRVFTGEGRGTEPVPALSGR